MSENLTLDWTSIQAFTANDEDGILDDPIHIDRSECNCTDGSNHTIHFTIPNETPIRIVYEVLLDKDQADPLQQMDISNRFELKGFSDKVEEKIDISRYEEGNVKLYSMEFLKYEEGNASHALRGAEFALYDDVLGELDKVTVTGEDGVVDLYYTFSDDHGETLVANNPYHIEERKKPTGYDFTEDAPAGYDIPGFEEGKYYFIVSDHLTGSITINGETTQTEIINGKITYKGQQYVVYKRGAASQNIYNTPFETSIKLGALKNLLGLDLEEGAFTFVLEAKDGAPTADPLNHIIEKSNDADGKADFGTITYKYSDLDEQRDANGNVTSASKTYNYTITEQHPADATLVSGNIWIKDGLKYDCTPRQVEVTVSLNAAKDGLDVVVKIDGEEVDPDDANAYWAEVENEYNAEGKKQFFAHKNMEGRDIEEGEFEFVIDLGSKPGSDR